MIAANEPIVALLVEDNPADAELIAVRLDPGTGVSRMPVRLVLAESVAAACAALRSQAIDVVILDLGLPDARGLQALHRIRAASSDVPVIVLTGSADQALALQALRAGAQDYVAKPPPDGPTLARILRYARERQHLLHELDSAVRASATAARRWRLLAEVGKLLAGLPEPRDALRDVGRLLVPDAADCLVLHIHADESVPAVLEVAHVDAARGAELRTHVDALLAHAAALGDGPGGDAAPSRREDGAETLSEDGAMQMALESLGVGTGTCVPLRSGGRMRGLLLLCVAAGRHDATVDVEFVRSLADRIGLALEKARLLRQTERALEARDRAVGIVSHDLGNPLSTIEICAAALLDREPPSAGGVRTMAELIERSVVWMRRIVRDLLDRSSLDAGRLALEQRPTNLPDVIAGVQLLFAPTAQEQEIAFSVQTEHGLPQVNADADRLLQVLSNLLSNAMKFTPAGGRVELSVRIVAPDAHAPERAHGGRQDAICFSVSDTGPGIPAEERAHVFDWFWHSPRGKAGGTGLGLAIAKGLVEAHGSALHVETGPEGGTTFWFTLPGLLDADSHVADASADDPPTVDAPAAVSC